MYKVSDGSTVHALWADPNTSQAKIRQLLDTQVQHNETLQQKLEKNREELTAAKAKIKHFEDAVASVGSSSHLDPQELLTQISLRDSIIQCLQQELALLKTEKAQGAAPSKSDHVSLEEHLLRAKARTQAIAEQYASLHEEETQRVQSNMALGGQPPPPRGILGLSSKQHSQIGQSQNIALALHPPRQEGPNRPTLQPQHGGGVKVWE